MVIMITSVYVNGMPTPSQENSRLASTKNIRYLGTIMDDFLVEGTPTQYPIGFGMCVSLIGPGIFFGFLVLLDDVDTTAYNQYMLQEYILAYLKYMTRSKNRKVVTLKNASYYLRRFFNFATSQGIDHPSGITKGLVEAYTDSLFGYSTTSKYLYLAAVRRFLKFLKAQKIPSLDPSLIDPPYPQKKPVDFDSIPSKLELDDLLNFNPLSLIDYRDKALINLLYYSGIRLSELMKLTPVQLNFEVNRILIRTKNKKVRVLFLHSRAKSLLMAYFDALHFPLPPLKPMFVNLDNAKPLSMRHIQRMIAQRGRDLGFRYPLSASTFRIALERDLKDQGASPEAIAMILGFSPASLVQEDTTLAPLPHEDTFRKLK